MIQTIQTIWNLVKGRAPEAPLTVDETHAALELVAEGAGNAGVSYAYRALHGHSLRGQVSAYWCWRALDSHECCEAYLPTMWRAYASTRAVSPIALDGAFVLACGVDQALVHKGGVWRLVHGTGGVTLVDEESARVLVREALVTLYDRASALQADANTTQQTFGHTWARLYRASVRYAEQELGDLGLGYLATLAGCDEDMAWWYAGGYED